MATHDTEQYQQFKEVNKRLGCTYCEDYYTKKIPHTFGCVERRCKWSYDEKHKPNTTDCPYAEELMQYPSYIAFVESRPVSELL